MTLREQRSLLARLLAKLIQHAEAEGYEVTINEVLRSKAQAMANAKSGAGISNSLHLVGLAADLNLFKNGVWLTQTEDHKPLGVWWEKQHPLCRWGGRFGDGNHYSLEWNGVK